MVSDGRLPKEGQWDRKPTLFALFEDGYIYHSFHRVPSAALRSPGATHVDPLRGCCIDSFFCFEELGKVTW